MEPIPPRIRPPGVCSRPAYCSPSAEAHTVRPQTKHPQAAIPKQKPAAGCPAGSPVQRLISSVGAAISRPPGIGSPPAYCSPPVGAHSVRPQTKHPKATIPKQKPAAGCPAGSRVQRPVPSVGAAISRPPGVCSRPAYCSPSAEAHTVRPQTKHPQAAIPKQKPAAGCPAGSPVQRLISSVGAAISRPPG